MKKLTISAILSLTLIFAPFYGCADGDRALSPYFYAMNADAAISIPSDIKNADVPKYNRLISDTAGVLLALNDSLSATGETSTLYKFNAAAAGETVQIDRDLSAVLSLALEVHEFTDGYYNPAIYYGVRAFGFTGGKKLDELPAKEETDAYARLASHFSEIELYEENENYYAVKPAYTEVVNGEELTLKLDLGGIGKGYAADIVDGLFDKNGFENGYFSFGSSSITCKKSGSGGAYSLGFTNPRPQNYGAEYLTTNVSDCKLSSSGDYENYFERDGVRYCHIFNPFTGRPVDGGVMSATVIGGSAAKADALTTALMAMGYRSAIRFIDEKLSDLRVAISVEIDGGYFVYTNMPDGAYTIADERFKAITKEI